MTATEDLGTPTQIAATASGIAAGSGVISLYEAEMCTVVQVGDRIGVIPATSELHRELERRPASVERHLASDAILYPTTDDR